MKNIMIKTCLVIFATLILNIEVNAQTWDPQGPQYTDGLKRELNRGISDTARALIMAELSNEYRNFSDSALIFGQKALELSKKIKFPKGEAYALYALGNFYRLEGDFPKAMNTLLAGLHIAEVLNDSSLTAKSVSSVGIVYSQMNDNLQAIKYFKKSRSLFEMMGNTTMVSQLNANISRGFRRNNQLDSALVYTKMALRYLDIDNEDALTSWIIMEAGTLQFELGNKEAAFASLHNCIDINAKNDDNFYGSFAFNVIADFFKKSGQPDSSIYYAKKGLEAAQKIGFKFGALEASNLLAETYESRDIKEALYYQKISRSINDELYGAKIVQGLQKILSEEQERLREVEENKIAEKNRLRQYLMWAGLIIPSLFAFFLYRNNIKKHRSNELLKSTLSDLKSTQAQLIQSEKMASLGELTAGIAHEIQNPLNFVNNFSDLNTELIEEMRHALIMGDSKEAMQIALDVQANQDKISSHGKRADTIVKGMFQHSRTSSGRKELSDINKMANEYLQLAYHGFRAKDMNFNITMNTSYDPAIEMVNIIPQDIGRVLLNLYNNSFYAGSEKRKKQPEGFEPTIYVCTKKVGDQIEITVADNGNGIPEQIVDKVFQPFFTTKPTGQGTGLGLSLSYDIIKAHQGSINIRNTPGEGAEFIITLPTKA